MASSAGMSRNIPTRVPRLVPMFNPVASRLLRVGRLMGPNALLTVRGRKSGEPRTTPVALVEVRGRRWVIGTFGDTNWVRNLRAAGEGDISAGRRNLHVKAVELTQEEAAQFFTEVLGPYVGEGVLKRLVLRMLGGDDIVTDPAAAAAKRPVFELTRP
jgi:deazaflavin-dependent oxidoreductase (nitroreductase family)